MKLFSVDSRRLGRTILIVVPAFVAALFVFMQLGAGAWMENLISTENWVNFKIPEDALPLQHGEFKVSSEGVTICNKSTDPWSSLLIQIQALGATRYVATLRHLANGKCKLIPIEDFAEPSWKRLRAYRGIAITRVEVLTDIPRKAYAVQQVSTH